MQIPLDFWNVSLFLAVTSIILLITAQLISAYDGPASILIEQKKLKTAAITTGILFLATVAVRVYAIVTSS
jgi:hypothetical protein